MEFSDSTRKRKTYRINVERWRERKPSKKGIYVSPIKKGFPFQKTKVAAVKGGKRALKGPKTVTDTSSTGPMSDKKPLRNTDIPNKPGSTTRSVNKNYGPCWQGADPSQKKSAVRLQRPPQVTKRSKMTAVLHPHHWLGCDEIDFASYLLASEYPHIHGFQSSVLFSVLHDGGIVGTPSSPFVQILHTGGNHWVTASNLFCRDNQVCIYDSLSTMLNNKDKQILSWLLRPMEDQFTIILPAVQHQSNSSNCGLFAFAFALCCNLRPENC
ncbi:uncharacterized protein LOC130097713 [Rhinichthys klamathensis goyatoka]|uniref:uncharacterized protein LOC130097713 n=1 Tax=Rhinichthys klamathensis goyatoka TaxID=3034132 RepID=UPI0024B550D7|nr:uncharacterized protein LOC130097713 [Rhinichthys klamathensis goyatoka]